jgi:hypothetical protein
MKPCFITDFALYCYIETGNFKHVLIFVDHPFLLRLNAETVIDT